MRNHSRISAPLFLLLVATGCKKNIGFDAGGPITQYLIGKWSLEKVVSPTGTKLGSQIGYTEVVEIGNQNGNYDKVFRNDTLLFTDRWLNTPAPEANAKTMTITVFYFSHGKRLFKHTGAGEHRMIEASAYLPMNNAQPDTIRYFYQLIR
ncbi:hypothetical protein IC229_34405 [Spirosoma sp. BT702]|uniref:Uncharacterized protein n=1 Tax=Spirosoma profusum TaxID=2771354 RepID=A0A927AWM5_9BACT|nr:hypothetical protein [Spirosoma profusum]MBD2705749.1 hypothetical protein [Spirosoma profusum]